MALKRVADTPPLLQIQCEQCVGGRGSCRRSAWREAAYETASSADLGGSSEYSNENFEDRSGEGFHVNSNWTWVSRS